MNHHYRPQGPKRLHRPFQQLAMRRCGLTALVLVGGGLSFTGSLLPSLRSRRAFEDQRPIQLGATETETWSSATEKAEKKVWSWNLCLWCMVVAFQTSITSVRGDLVLWSALSGLLGLCRWIYGSKSRPRLRRGSMAHFAIRGATLAPVLSLVLELVLLPLVFWVSPPLAGFLYTTGTMGGVEELVKFMVLIWLSWSTWKPWEPKPQVARSWPQSLKGVMLAGFSLGVGFMVTENWGYFNLSAPLFRKLDWALQHPNLAMDEVTEAGRLIDFRIFLNPHPFLSGIAAGRFAQWTSKSTQKTLTCKRLWWVLWPSVVLHALANLLSDGEGDVRRVILQLICWRVFKKTWNSLESTAEGRNNS